jgi:hypothetical protein
MRHFVAGFITLALVLAVTACGSGDSTGSKDSSDKGGSVLSKEPKSVEDYRAVLDKLGIKLYEGSEIGGVDGPLTTYVPADKGSHKAIMDHYKEQVEGALKGKGEWVKHMKTASNISYRKGYTGWFFGVAIDSKKTEKGYKVTLSYHKH